MKKLPKKKHPATSESATVEELPVNESAANDDSSNICVDIQRATDSETTPSDQQFELWVKTALAGKYRQAEVVIRLVDRDEARQFNHQYRQKDYATNVLSFPAELPEGIPADVAGSMLGDLLICAPVVAEEANSQGKKEVDHWAHLSVHGVLHLLGYDHEIESEAAVMEALEVEILKELGISDPYCDN